MNHSANGNSSDSTRSAAGQRGLEPRWYLDEDVFEFETQNVFAKAWTPVGYETQLPGTGSFFLEKIRDCDCVILRDQQQKVRAFQNVCRHRGTQLCTDKEGQLKSALACPYHGWKYDFEGKLVSAPNMQSVDTFDPADFGLVEFQVKSWNGLILANDQPNVELFLERLNPIVDVYGLSEFRTVKSIHYDVAANWKLIFQNFNECYHCPSVHPQLTPYSDYRESENDFADGEVLGGPMKIRKTANSITVDGTLCGALPKDFPGRETDNARYYTIFPNLFVSLFPDYIMIHRLRPIQKDRTCIECDFLFHPATINSADFKSEKASDFWDLTNRQDWEMCERVQRGLSTPGFRPSPYSDLESLLAAFDGFYLRQMNDLGYRI